MNTVNNKRSQSSKKAIQKAYLNLVIARADINTITVSDICKKAGINRTTFYSNFLDMPDMIDSIEQWMLQEFLGFFRDETSNAKHSMDFNKLFESIQENQIFYKLYFKLGFDFKKIFVENEPTQIWKNYFNDESTVDYHIEFFAAGITAIIKKWLYEGCPGTSKRMGQMLAEEYQKKNTFE